MQNFRLIAAAALLTLAIPARAEIVLLQNGSVLEGRVEQLPDEVILKQPGGMIRLRSAEVAHVGPSLVAVYDWLRQSRIGRRGSSEKHLALADWAIDNQLWPQAARELLDARPYNPGSGRLALLERRFDELTRPTPPPAERRFDPRVVATSHEAPVDSAEALSEEPLPTIPDSSIEFFTRRVQPLLRNGCTTAGCHRGGEGDPFLLDESWLRGHADARSTTRNLRTALAEIDLGSPEQSRLLAIAAGPHHGVTPIRGPRREELLKKLSDWVHEIAAANATQLPPPSDESVDPAVMPAQEPSLDPAVTPAVYQPAPLVRGGQTRPLGPRDEFDPAIFNERFRRPEDDLPLSERPAR